MLTIKELPVPEPLPGQVTIQVKAFGVNHAETHMRKGEWDEWQPVSGIECVGVVHACPGGEFDAGTTVAAVMGGMGRVIPGAPSATSCTTESLSSARVAFTYSRK